MDTTHSLRDTNDPGTLAEDVEPVPKKRPWSKPTVHRMHRITRVKTGTYSNYVKPESFSYVAQS